MHIITDRCLSTEDLFFNKSVICEKSFNFVRSISGHLIQELSCSPQPCNLPEQVASHRSNFTF